MAKGNGETWLTGLSEDDLGFLKRFVLLSGSLKDLATAYDVSYPTVRLRLDRLIEKIRILDSAKQMSRFERSLRAAFADGKLDEATFGILLAAYRKDSGAK